MKEMNDVMRGRVAVRTGVGDGRVDSAEVAVEFGTVS